MSEILQGMKLLKVHGWEIVFGKHLIAVRNKELKNLDRDLLYRSIMSKSNNSSIKLFLDETQMDFNVQTMQSGSSTPVIFCPFVFRQSMMMMRNTHRETKCVQK